MNLPEISIPKAILDSLPLDQVPALMHPPLVHFAIVLPIMIVLLELVNIIVKRGETPEEPKGRGVSALSLILILAMLVIFSLAYISGSVDGKAAWDLLGGAGQSELKEHKLIGTYLVYGTLVLLAFKLLAMLAGTKARLLLLIIALVFAAATLRQGKDGGELVYKYGANVAKVAELDEKLFDLEDAEDTDAVKAESVKVEDSVAKKEEAALESTKPVEGEAAAKAEVEETQAKDALEAKESAEAFKEEAVADEKKVDEATAEAKVNETEAKEEAKASEESGEFKQESEADTSKEVTPAEKSAVE